ncbi:MAG: hypothetical protein WA791_09405 [Rhodomicrobium sp.]
MQISAIEIEAEIIRSECRTSADPARDTRTLARGWVQKALALGCHPMAVQQPLSGADSGEWKIATREADGGIRMEPPEELWDEIFILLLSLGRMEFDAALKLWHGNFLPGDCSPRALALRLRTARQALNMELADFYGCCAIGEGAAAMIETAPASLAFPSLEIADLLSRRHGIPELWSIFGMAQELEAATRSPLHC